MANDELMDQWAAEDDALVPKPTAPIVPRDDKFVNKKRWGVDTPLEMEPRKYDPEKSSSLDPESLRYWAEFNPILGAISGGEKMASGKWVEGGLLVAGSVIPATMVSRIFGGAVKAGRNMIGKTVNGKYISKEVLEKWDNLMRQGDENLKMDRFNIDREKALRKVQDLNIEEEALGIRNALSKNEWSKMWLEQKGQNFSLPGLVEAKEQALKAAHQLYSNDPKKLKLAIEMIEGEGLRFKNMPDRPNWDQGQAALQKLRGQPALKRFWNEGNMSGELNYSQMQRFGMEAKDAKIKGVPSQRDLDMQPAHKFDPGDYDLDK